MEFVAQYDDISDGENEAELQAQQFAAKVAEQHMTTQVHSISELDAVHPGDDLDTAQECGVEESEEEQEGSCEGTSDNDEDVEVRPSAAPSTMLSDLHYAAMASGLYEPAQSAEAVDDPNEIGIDDAESNEAASETQANHAQITAVSAEESSSDTSSDTSSDAGEPDQEHESLKRGDGLTEEELQSGVAPDEVPRTKNEVELEINPVEIQIAADEPIVIVGHVMYRLDHEHTAVVQSEKTTTPLGEGSILCFDDKSILGRIYETFGPVMQPFYVTRWHPSQPPLKEFAPGTSIYSPREHAFVVKPSELVSKGCDASNIYDEELPAHEQDFSDDEQEAAVKAQKKKRTRAQAKDKQQPAEEPVPSQTAAGVTAPQQQSPQYFQHLPQPQLPPHQQQFYQHQQQHHHHHQQQQHFPQFGTAGASFMPAPPTSAAPTSAVPRPAPPPGPPPSPAPATHQFTPSPVYLTQQAPVQYPTFHYHASHVTQPQYPSFQQPPPAQYFPPAYLQHPLPQHPQPSAQPQHPQQTYQFQHPPPR